LTQVRPALGELLAGDAADQPGVAAEFVMQAFEQFAARSLRAPAAVQCAAVDAGDHEADDVRFHAELTGRRCTDRQRYCRADLRLCDGNAQEKDLVHGSTQGQVGDCLRV
jgi:hypothetical protein